MSRQLFHYQRNHLFFDGLDLSNLEAVRHYHEPVLIYKRSLIRERIHWIKSWTKLKRLHFAMKANFHPEVLKIFLQENCGLDVVSLGEIEAALKVGFAAKDLIFSGVGKTKKELAWAIENQIYQINVESPDELRRIATMASGQSVNIGLRINPQIEAPTHPYIATALRDSKFGLDEQHLQDCLNILKTSPHLKLKCVSFHIGSQILDTAVFAEAVNKTKNIYSELKNQFSDLNRLDIGGGLGLDYRDHDLDRDRQLLLDLVRRLDQSLENFSDEVLCEMGRYMVARSAVFVCQVQYLKKMSDRPMAILDLGMNNNMRPSLYQAYHHFYAMIKAEGEDTAQSIVGPLCESSDVFHKDFKIQKLAADDLLVMADAGAYVRSMASEYNLKKIAPEVFVD